MKDIKSYVIGLLTCGYLFGGIFDNVENPNGEPFTLSIAWASVSYEPSERIFGIPPNEIAPVRLGKGYTNTRWKLLLPVTFWLTLTYEQYKDRSEKYTIPTGAPVHSDFNGGTYWADKGTVISVGGELHLPLYKLWKR